MRSPSDRTSRSWASSRTRSRQPKPGRTLANAGLLGRVTVHHIPSGELPYPKYFANLVVSDKAVVSRDFPTDWSEIQRVLRPYGGVAMLGGPQTGIGRC